MKKSILFIIALTTFTVINSCKKDQVTDAGKGSLRLEFDHQVNGAAMQFNKDYVNAAGETMQFTLFKYFISNISLVRTDGTIYTLPKDECYYLIEELASGANPLLTLNNIPTGEYKEVRFIVGVDSLKNCAPLNERTGALDPATSGMYWAWNSGYIFLKVEGKSPVVAGHPDATGDNFIYHIGLFGGYSSPTVNNIKSITLSKSGETAKVSSSISPQVHIVVDVMEIFKNPTTFSLATKPTIHVDPASKTLADNYVDMFSIDHIHK
ncbi:MAG: MbnP family protein [Chitinophagales bacterium]|jgi:hypothetical protein|nr:hypothetical protein [Sphingobacteriales bacterium]